METMSQSIGALAKALASAQAELRPAEKSAVNPAFKSRYADLPAVFDAVRIILPRHGLAVSQVSLPVDGPRCGVRTILMHESGEWLASDTILPFGRGDGPQAYGSAMTYARRYGLAAIVGVVADDDDDGEAAQKSYRNGNGGGGQRPAQSSSAPRNGNGGNGSGPTEKQAKAIWAISCNHLGTRERDVLADFWSDFLGRDVQSTKDFSAEDARAFLDQYGNGGSGGGNRQAPERDDRDDDDSVPF